MYYKRNDDRLRALHPWVVKSTPRGLHPWIVKQRRPAARVASTVARVHANSAAAGGRKQRKSAREYPRLLLEYSCSTPYRAGGRKQRQARAADARARRGGDGVALRHGGRIREYPRSAGCVALWCNAVGRVAAYYTHAVLRRDLSFHVVQRLRCLTACSLRMLHVASRAACCLLHADTLTRLTTLSHS